MSSMHWKSGGRRSLVVSALVVSALVLLAPACDEPADLEVTESREAPLAGGTWVGSVDGSDMAVGAVIADGKLKLYTCGGPDELTASRWFKGPAIGPEFALTSGAWKITGERVGGRLEGTLRTPEGEERSWSAEPTVADTHAGLYAADTHGCNSGVVIRQDAPAAPLSAQGTWCDDHGDVAQIIVLSPLQATRRGVAVATTRRDIAPFQVARVTP